MLPATMKVLSLVMLFGLCAGMLPAAVIGEKEDTRPGAAWPHSAVQAQAFYIAWGKKLEDRTFIVIEPGDRLRRPVVVATIHEKTGKLRVAYSGTAFRDARGAIHIDCRKKPVIGPESKTWSPDSFSIEADGKVWCKDDRQYRANPGKVLKWIVSPKNKSITKGTDLIAFLNKDLSYKSLRLLVRVHLEGVL